MFTAAKVFHQQTEDEGQHEKNDALCQRVRLHAISVLPNPAVLPVIFCTDVDGNPSELGLRPDPAVFLRMQQIVEG